MTHRLGFTRKVRLAHLDFAFERLCAAGAVSAQELDAILAPDIPGPNRRAKAVDEIRKAFTSPGTQPLVSQALLLAENKPLADNDRLALYWSLFLVSFPFVRQTWTVVGRLENLMPEFTTRAFVSRLTDTYGGGRTTLNSICEALGMMGDWGVVMREAPGRYRVAPRRPITKDAQRLLLLAVCLTYEPPVVFLEQFSDNQALFPFRLHLSATDLRHRGSLLRVSLQGGRQVVVEPRAAPPADRS